ncbi:MAG: hypothetical protein ACRENX_07005 [Candidatus Dormibacteria bacterium]
MKLTLNRGAIGLAALATVALVGCGSAGASLHGPAGTILQAANTRALSSSFQVSFTGQLQVDLSGVTLPGGVSAAGLALLQSEIDSARLTGVAQVQSPTEAEVSFTLSPLLTQTWHVLTLNGDEYISENGKQWYSEADTASSSAAAAAGGLGNLKSELKSWGLELKNSATVTKLGTTTIGGNQVEHLQTTIAGASLNQSMAGILAEVVTGLGTQGAALKADLPAIQQLLQFTQVKSDSYILTSTGQLAKTVATAGLNLNLSALATLDPGQSGLPAGSASLTMTDSGTFSDYGKNFNLQKPSDILPGNPPAPSGLGGALS